MNKEELKKLANEKPNVITRILKSNFNKLYNEINSKFNDISKFSEKLFLYLNGMPNIGVCNSNECNNKCRFISLNKGYSEYCSTQCAANELKETRSKSIKETLIKKYNVNSPSKIKDVKEKLKKYHNDGRYDYTDIAEKSKKTKLEKYGDENYNNVKLSKTTKLEKYGDENYNNRNKFLETLDERYNSNIHPNTLKSTKSRSISGEIGFKSEKFKQWLDNNSIENTSQLDDVKNKKIKNAINKSYSRVVNRISEYVTPQFSESEFVGVKYYDYKYKFSCNKCKEVFNDYLYSGHIPRCPICFPKNEYTSIGQIELFNFIKEILPNNDVILNDRSVLNGKEIDVFIPDLKIGIEYNGLYFHTEVNGGKNKKYHLNKTNDARDKNIRLIHILDVDWYYNREVIKNRLRYILSKKVERVYARNCKIIELSKEEKTKFLKNNHLQGNDKSQIWIGLLHNNEIVTVMTFGNLRSIMGSKSKENEYELYRYTSVKNVIGGASKLLQYFIRKYTPSKIITYSDINWGYSNFYEKIGFNYVNNTPPNYKYIHKGKLIHRSNFQKHKLKDKLEKFDPNLTEWENMQLNGYDRIWDCGHMKYELVL